MVYFDRAILRFDGACQPNPGEGGGGYVIVDDYNDDVILEGQRYVGGNCTNNVAEYFGLIAALQDLRDSPHEFDHLVIEGDSLLVINQMTGDYSVKHRRLRPLYQRAMKLISSCEGRDFKTVSFRHIDRSDNGHADDLARCAINEERTWSRDHY